MSAAASREPSAPRAIYAERLHARRREAAKHDRRARIVSNGRLAVFALGAAAAWLALSRELFAVWWLLVPALAFAGLVLVHDVVIRARERAARAAEWYEAGLARLAHRWAGSGQAGERFRDSAHPYGDDLDLFGRGSLYELLCAARTHRGEETLARWLTSAGETQALRARQEAVGELRPALDLREDLALLGTDLRDGVHTAALCAWAAADPIPFPRGARPAALVLAGLAAVALAAWILAGVGPLPLVGFAVAEAALWLWLRTRIGRVIRAVEQPARDLRLLAELLRRLERERFRSAHLRALRSALDTEGEPPSRQVERLLRLLDLLDARRNQLFAPLAALLLWSAHFATAIEAWRRRSGPAVGRWVEALGELEALSSLAGYAFERPGDPFPELVGQGPLFEGEGLGHPLLPEARCVRNDVVLSGAQALLVVSGSNMSGKSTLLRTVGVNAVLALAGAPVRARRLRLSGLAVGATIRVLDSLQAGSSHFYAELTRIRDIVSCAAGPLPTLFLLDEIFHGTNSHDRRVGAEAVVRALLARGAVGLVTTHDLALAAVADALAPRGANVHFEDQLVDGEIHFDYRMRPGVVKRSNALALMRSVGLEV